MKVTGHYVISPSGKETSVQLLKDAEAGEYPHLIPRSFSGKPKSTAGYIVCEINRKPQLVLEDRILHRKAS